MFANKIVIVDDEQSIRELVADVLEAEKFNTRENNEPIADILVCDSTIPFCDSLKKCIDSGVSAIIQTGGSSDDKEFIEYCNEHDVVMVFTDMTHISY